MALAGVIAAAALRGQSDRPPQAFEAASVRLLPPPASGRVVTGGGPGTADPVRLTRSNVTLASILVEAFQVQGNLIAGPDWLLSERYEITAIVAAGATRDQIPAMLQTLLAERFGLTFHRERRNVSGYALVVSKSGPKVKPTGGSPAPIPGRDGIPELPDGVAPGAIKIDSAGSVRRTAAGGMSMAKLADYLAGQLSAPIADMTGLTGDYDIVLYVSKPARPDSAPPPVVPQAGSGPDLASAVREQLGLELQSGTVAVDRIVIEKTPSAN